MHDKGDIISISGHQYEVVSWYNGGTPLVGVIRRYVGKHVDSGIVGVLPELSHFVDDESATEALKREFDTAQEFYL